MTRNIVFFVYPGFDLLDLAGPMSVFGDVGIYRDNPYVLQVVSETGGPIASTVGAPVLTTRLDDQVPIDTFVVVGGWPGCKQRPSEAMARFVARAAARSRRVASVCTGAFLLAEAGLMQGRRCTSHWRYAADLQAAFPDLKVDADRIYMRDGNVWTSAGSSAGIDLGLALIEEDVGLQVSQSVARGLVVYHRRLGGQSQYSALLEMDPPSDRIRGALAFARERLHEPLPVERLAEAANLSPRQFGRAFLAETGTSPAKAVERLRAEAARPMVESSAQALDQIGLAVGFSDPERMRQAFVRCFGQPPQALRRAGRANRAGEPSGDVEAYPPLSA